MISNIWRKSCCKRRQSKLGMSTISQDLSRKSRTAQIQIFEILPPISCSCASTNDCRPISTLWCAKNDPNQSMAQNDLPPSWIFDSIEATVFVGSFFPAAQKVLQDFVNFDEEQLSPAWCWLLLWSIKSIWTWKICCWFLGTLERRTMRADGLWQLGNCSYHIPYWSILNKSGSRIKALNLQNV